MEILKNLVGEYIYIVNSYPITAFYYKDKKIVKSHKIDDLDKYLITICTKMNVIDNHMVDFVLKNLSIIDELVIEKNGINLFSIGVKK